MFVWTFISADFVFASYEPTLAELVDKTLDQNNVIKSAAEDSRAEKKLVTSQYNLPDPSIGISKLNRGNETEYLTIQQKIRFPVKYWLAGKAQKELFKSSQNKLVQTQFELRADITNLYFNLYSVQKTVELTRANLQAVKDFARVAEKKYASGKTSQADSMKAHFEITQLEINLLHLEQDEVSLQSMIKTLLSDMGGEDLSLMGLNIEKPLVNVTNLERLDQQLKSFVKENSPGLKVQEKKMEAAKLKRSLAKWEFAPDFNVQLQQRMSGLPEDSKIVSINATIPLWFWKNSSEASHASARANAEEYRYRDLSLKVMSKFKTLKSRIEKTDKTLLIYKTTLMPQAEGAYRSTRSAYKAGRTSFLNLLDSERSLYKVKQDYYKSLTAFVSDVVEMESLIGQSISNLYGVKGVIR